MIVRNGLAALPGEQDFRRLELRVEDGRFVEIAQRIDPREGEAAVDASGLMVFPGAIDPHVHFDEPGFEQREDFLHGTSEAARGGVTTVVDMPCTSLPPVIDAAAFDNKLAAVSRSAVVDFAFFGGVSGHAVARSLGEGASLPAPGAMQELASRGVVGFKCYFISGMETFTRVTHEDFSRIVAEGARLGRPILLHAEDLDYVTSRTARIKALRAAGALPGGTAPSWEDYAASRDEAAETVAVAAAVELAGSDAPSLHVVHVGTARAAELAAGAGATCETCAHYLAFGREDFARLGPALKTAPVVKSRAGRDRLWELLASGRIGFVTSDHAPAPDSEKLTGNPWTAYGGIPGTGTLFPFLLSEGLFTGRLTLPRFLEAASSAAARRYNLHARKGSIEVGKDADFVLVDPAATFTQRGADLLSKGRMTPFEGMTFKGRIAATYVRGQAAWKATAPDGPQSPGGRIVAAPGSGKFLPWGYR